MIPTGYHPPTPEGGTPTPQVEQASASASRPPVSTSGLRVLLESATERPWLVFDMDQGKPTDERVNDHGWWWVWRQSSMPFYGGVLEMERHAGDCNGKPDKCCRSVVGSAAITDGDDGAREYADAALIAAAVNALPDLLDKADRLEVLEAGLRALCDWPVGRPTGDVDRLIPSSDVTRLLDGGAS